MEQFFAQHWEVVTGFISLLIVFIGFLIKISFNNAEKQEKKLEAKIIEVEQNAKKSIEKIEIEIEKLEVEQRKMTENYKKEFVEVKENSHLVKEEIIGEIHKLSITMVQLVDAVKAQKEFCLQVQDSKIINKRKSHIDDKKI